MMKVNKLNKLKNGLYEVHIDDDLLILDEETIIKYRLLIGKDILESDLKSIKLEDEINKLVNKCFQYSFKYKKSLNEVKRYLKEKNIDNDIIIRVIDILVEKKLIDDLSIAKDIASYLARNSNGKLLIQEKLKQRLFTSSTINEAIESINEDDYKYGKYKIILKLEKKYSKEEEKIRALKIKKQLYAHGYLGDD